MLKTKIAVYDFKNIIVTIQLCMLIVPAFCQKDTIKKINLFSDTLSFSIQEVKTDSSNKRVLFVPVKSQLVYDFKYQYPYYQVESKKWQPGDQVRFHFMHLPSKGYIYVFSVDGENNVKTLPVININSTVKKPFNYPDSLKTLTFKVNGKERICLWYCPDSIPYVESLISGIELTMGSFVYRNNGQLGKSLLLPGFGWHLNNSSFGFVTTPKFFHLPESFILPVIIEFDVPKKNNML